MATNAQLEYGLKDAGKGFARRKAAADDDQPRLGRGHGGEGSQPHAG
jgi:hypothetical protein